MNIENKDTLVPYTLDLCHEVYERYIPDPMMTYDQFYYDSDKIDRYFEVKVMDSSRCFFAIKHENITVGEIQLKYINYEEKHGTLSILIINDEYKNKGIGSKAIKSMIKYASESLDLKKIYADAIHRNTRSQFVLERLGFKYIKEDDILRYYEYII